jgi:hypothetical protein
VQAGDYTCFMRIAHRAIFRWECFPSKGRTLSSWAAGVRRALYTNMNTAVSNDFSPELPPSEGAPFARKMFNFYLRPH